MVAEVSDEGRTVFLSSHTLSEVQRVADRVGIIRNGRLITVESVADSEVEVRCGRWSLCWTRRLRRRCSRV